MNYFWISRRVAMGFHRQQLGYAPSSPDVFVECFSLWCLFLLPIFLPKKGKHEVIATDTRHAYYQIPL